MSEGLLTRIQPGASREVLEDVGGSRADRRQPLQMSPLDLLAKSVGGLASRVLRSSLMVIRLLLTEFAPAITPLLPVP